mmetsp:Transcript_23074/g.27142  ORF Transcript_23074/g.27142 Transcript_23074/m.27142 type:complete len:616 (+) Transcript_23074:112-1959(+)
MERNPVLGHDQEPSSYSKKWLIAGATMIALSVVAYNKQSSNSVKTDLKIGTNGNNQHEKSMSSSSSRSTPNIFLFTCDDMGWNDIGYNSGDLSRATPYMKALAQKGITLSHYYTQPSCTPSRVTMMTGKFAYRNGFQNHELLHNDYTGVPLSNKMMPEHMKELGYATLGFGKWNIGHCNSRYLPSARGFDHFLGYLCPGHGYTDHNCGTASGYRDMIEDWSVDGVHKWSNGADYLGTYDTLIYKEETQKALRRHFSEYGGESAPMFMWLAHHGIHGEYDSDPIPPSELLSKENKKYLKVLRKRLDQSGKHSDDYTKFFKMRMITASVLMSLDNSLKNLVETIEDVGQLSNSIIFVNSDNGADPDYTQGHPGNNFPLRSEKFSYYEGGVRVPAFVYGPGHIPIKSEGSTYHGMMHHVDLLTTFYSLGGGDYGDLDSDVDGMDQWAAIKGDTSSPRTELVLNLPRSKTWKMGEQLTSEGIALRMGNYKLLYNHVYDSWFSPSPGDDFTSASDMMAAWCQYSFYDLTESSGCVFANFLFNVLDDPTEQTNLWHHSDYKDIKANMIKRAEELVAAQINDYGKIIPEYYERGHGEDDSTYTDAFQAHGDYVVPFDCDVIH